MDLIKKPRTRMSFESARASRLAAIQACFQINSTSQPARTVIDEFINHRFVNDDYPYPPDIDFFEKLVLQTTARVDDVTALISQHLAESHNMESIDSVLRSILTVGATELSESIVPIPAPVVISEYIDLTKGFLGPGEASLTNAVLDGIARALGLQMSKNASI